MRVNQIMTPDVITIDKNSPLSNAIDLMQRSAVSRLVVVENGKIVGVLTERDIMRELGSAKSYRQPPGRMHISNAMTTNVITVAPDVMAKRAAEIMLEHDISGLPVVAEGKLVGIVTKLDFTKVCSDLEDVFAGQVMQSSPITASPTDRAIHARKLLLEEDLVGLPVVERGALVGMVTVRDLAMKLAAFQEVVPDRYKSERIRHLLVGDIMTRPVTTARTDAKLSEVARLMLEKRFSSMPVLNLQSELVGLITKTELTEVAWERL